MTDFAKLRGSYALDMGRSQIVFVARHAMVTKVSGAFTRATGSAVIDGERPAASSLRVDIEAGSVETGNDDRNAHLCSVDFFDVETFPSIVFVATDFAITGPDAVTVTGELTIRDVTAPVTVPFRWDGSVGETAGFTGSVTVSRRTWNLTWNAAIETGGVMVGDKVVLEFDVTAVRQSEA